MITLFVGSSGVAIYNHHCSVSGDESSYFVEYNKGCEDEGLVQDKQGATRHACCFSNQQNKEEINVECCSTDFQFVQIQTDLIQHHTDELQPIKVVLTHSNFTLPPAVNESKFHNKNWRGPPVLKPQTRRALQQLYLI